jgi:hypothetical protein
MQSGGRKQYNKQKQERIVLVPGDDTRVAVVRQICRRHCMDGWPTPSIEPSRSAGPAVSRSDSAR